MIFFVSVMTLCLLAASLIPFLEFQIWWIRAFDFPRLLFSVLLLINILLAVVFLDLDRFAAQLLLIINLLCLVYQSYWIIKYTPIYPVEVKSCESHCENNLIRIMTANVLMDNQNYSGLIKLIKINDPDLVLTLETDQKWENNLKTIEADYPYSFKCPMDNLYGMHLYSKLPLLDFEIKYLIENDKPSMHGLVQLNSEKKIRVHFLHPAPPSPTENDDSSERDAELLIVAKSVTDTDTPVIVAGDLNDVAWSKTTLLFRKISGLLDPRIGRGMFNTYHAEYIFFRWPLDHLFHSEHFTLKSMKRLEYFGSDHFPLFTILKLNDHLPDQDGPEKDFEDVTKANEMIDKEDASVHQVPNPE